MIHSVTLEGLSAGPHTGAVLLRTAAIYRECRKYAAGIQNREEAEKAIVALVGEPLQWLVDTRELYEGTRVEPGGLSLDIESINDGWLSIRCFAQVSPLPTFMGGRFDFKASEDNLTVRCSPFGEVECVEMEP